jgi:hypothetical protein
MPLSAIKNREGPEAFPTKIPPKIQLELELHL